MRVVTDNPTKLKPKKRIFLKKYSTKKGSPTTAIAVAKPDKQDPRNTENKDRDNEEQLGEQNMIGALSLLAKETEKTQ